MLLQTNIRIADVNGKGYAEVSACDLTIEQTFVGYRLLFSFTINPYKSDINEAIQSPIKLLGLRIDLSLKVGNALLPIGSLIDTINHESRSLRGYQFKVIKYLNLNTHDFLRLVDRTHPGSLTLEAAFKPLLDGPAHEPSVQNATLTMPRSEWLDRVNALNLDRFELITIRVPVAASHLHAPFSAAVEKIREAESQFNSGNWNAVGACCRAAWKTVLTASPLPKGSDHIDHFLSAVRGDPRRKDFAKVLAKGLNDIQNAAVHLEGDPKTGKPSADLSREDALLCIHWYSAIIGYFSAV